MVSEALTVRDENLLDLLQWAAENGDVLVAYKTSSVARAGGVQIQWVDVRTSTGIRRACPGEMVVKMEDGSFDIRAKTLTAGVGRVQTESELAQHVRDCGLCLAGKIEHCTVGAVLLEVLGIPAGTDRATLSDTMLHGELAQVSHRLTDMERVVNEKYNALWGLLYPDNPTGWEYPGQIIRHLKDAIQDYRACQEVIDEFGIGRGERDDEDRWAPLALAARLKKLLAYYRKLEDKIP